MDYEEFEPPKHFGKVIMAVIVLVSIGMVVLVANTKMDLATQFAITAVAMVLGICAAIGFVVMSLFTAGRNLSDQWRDKSSKDEKRG